jgi:tRNA-binding protein
LPILHLTTNTRSSAVKPEIPYEDFAKLDLRVATILAAREHPNADKLLLLQIDTGDGQRQIVAGIRGHYRPEELVGRQIVVLCNLPEAVLRGEESQGMLLAASDGEHVVLLQPERQCQAGAGIK